MEKYSSGRKLQYCTGNSNIVDLLPLFNIIGLLYYFVYIAYCVEASISASIHHKKISN